MSTGIGDAVKRKEDKRFTTGKGKYTDDVRNDNQAYAAFVRSPHAHARVTGIDASAALAMDGVIDVLNGAQLTGDGIGNIICGWAVTSKDGSTPNHISVINSEPPASAKEDRNSDLLSRSTASFSCDSIEFWRNNLASYPASFTARINDDASVSPVTAAV